MDKAIIKKLKKVFSLLPGGKTDCRDFVLRRLKDDYPKTAAWVSQCYHPPAWWEVALEIANEEMEGYGVESIKFEDCNIENAFHVRDGSTACFDMVASFVNLGDSYIQTVIRDHVNERFVWNVAWGDLTEKPPRSWKSGGR